MKPKLLIPLLLCALMLSGCYRQAEEPFQQVDSAEVVEAATVAVVVADSEGGEDTSSADSATGDVAGAAPTRQQFITPEPAPGQIEQPTLIAPTADSVVITAPALTLSPFVPPSPTLSLEELLDPEDECVYQVQAGNTLFRLSLSWGPTVEEIMELNQLDSDALSIGQLLLIPGCESSEPEEIPTDEPVATEAVGAPEEQTEPVVTLIPETGPIVTDTPSGPLIHVVSSGQTLESISLRYRVDVHELRELNNLTDPNQLLVGQELQIPG